LSIAKQRAVGFILAWSLAFLHCGSINFTALLPNGHLSIIFYDVLHISYLGANLISLGTLHCQGVSVRSLDNSLVLLKDGEELF